MKLCELTSESYILPNTAQRVLIGVFMATTPASAMDLAQGNANMMAAMETLVKRGYVKMQNDGVTITQAGLQALHMNGLLDSYNLTDKAKNVYKHQSG